MSAMKIGNKISHVDTLFVYPIISYRSRFLSPSFLYRLKREECDFFPICFQFQMCIQDIKISGYYSISLSVFYG